MRPSWTLTGLGRALLAVSRYRPGRRSELRDRHPRHQVCCRCNRRPAHREVHRRDHRSTRTGCTFPFGKWAARSRIVPAAELRQAQVIVSAPTRAAHTLGKVLPWEVLRLRTYTGGTRAAHWSGVRTSSSPRLRGPHVTAVLEVHIINFVSAPTRAAHVLTVPLRGLP